MQSEKDIHIAGLIIKQLKAGLEPEMQQQLTDWMNESEENRHLVEQLADDHFVQQELEIFFSFDPARGADKLNMLSLPATADGPSENLPPYGLFISLKKYWLRYAAAVLLLLAIGTWLWDTSNRTTDKLTSTEHTETALQKILPGSNRATLTLADGSVIDLDSVQNGELAHQQGTVVTRKNGSIVYGQEQINTNAAAYNTMSTPRGGQFQLTLPDGTNVWLNAESSITFPLQFNEKHRTVTVKGEAYFEVSKKHSQPFTVRTDREEVTVLGTAFNVHAYGDEPAHKITLVEGAVKVSGKILKPGQAYLEGNIIQANIQQDIAWKNGFFDFEGANLKTVLSQLSRWYDLEIIYPQGIPKIEFGGRLKRDLTFSQIITILENSEVNFRLEGRTLIIKP